jgi:hypothetical protein
MEVLKELDGLFRAHAPETLMALFGASTSLLLFYLVGVVLRHLFGLQTRRADLEAGQDQATAALVEALVSAVVSEAGHLRTTLDGILDEALRRSEQHTQLLVTLAAQADETPGKTLALLRPEFDHLRRELRQAESRIVAKLAEEITSDEQQNGVAPKNYTEK